MVARAVAIQTTADCQRQWGSADDEYPDDHDGEAVD
jgi:hypothetical protein